LIAFGKGKNWFYKCLLDSKVTEGYIGTEQNITKSINESKVLFEDFPNVKLS